MLNTLKQAFQPNSTVSPARFFKSPEASGREIICSFCYIQRIGKRGVIDVWFPSELHRKIVERLKSNDSTILNELGVEWAAIREFSLIQESDKVEDFDPERLKKAIKDSIRWRGQDGYRVTVVMLGRYTKLGQFDELRIHDERLQDEISKLIHILYLDEESEQMSERCNEAVQSDKWSCAKILPHVIMTLGSMGMTGKGAGQSKKSASAVKKIIELVEFLPKTHVVHDVAVGLAIPDLETKHRREKHIEESEKFTAFQQLLAKVFEPLGHSSMSQLHGVDGAATNPEYRNHMMRGFGSLRAGDDTANFEAAQKFAL